jgi:hypothetical protein
MVCNPNVNASKSYNGITGPGQPTWFDTSCFQPTPNGAVRPGNTGRGTVRGPGFANLDASIMKNFLLNESGRWSLQMRGEFFSVTNHPNPNGFGSTNSTSTQFGEITSFRAPRIVQIGGKLIW